MRRTSWIWGVVAAAALSPSVVWASEGDSLPLVRTSSVSLTRATHGVDGTLEMWGLPPLPAGTVESDMARRRHPEVRVFDLGGKQLLSVPLKGMASGATLSAVESCTPRAPLYIVATPVVLGRGPSVGRWWSLLRVLDAKLIWPRDAKGNALSFADGDGASFAMEALGAERRCSVRGIKQGKASAWPKWRLPAPTLKRAAADIDANYTEYVRMVEPANATDKWLRAERLEEGTVPVGAEAGVSALPPTRFPVP